MKRIILFFVMILTIGCGTAQKNFEGKSAKLYKELDKVGRTMEFILSPQRIKSADREKLNMMIKSYRVGDTGFISIIDYNGKVQFNDHKDVRDFLSQDKKELKKYFSRSNGVFETGKEKKQIIAFKYLTTARYIMVLFIKSEDRWFHM